MTHPSPLDVTLQINLSAGDLAYAIPVVSSLVETHRADVCEVVVVADLCRPQPARDFHAATHVPAAPFADRLARLRELCATLQRAGTVDRIVFLEPDHEQLKALNRNYAGVATPRSHDHLGHAFSAYFLGWECARTRYVAHFDADILLWQQPGFSWLRAAVEALAHDEHLLAASPRLAPPPVQDDLIRRDDPRAWSPSWPLTRVAHGWMSPWFSTRCHVIDRDRLARWLPLTGARATTRDAAIHRVMTPLYALRALTGPNRSRIARGLMRRLPPFPLPPEVLLHEHAQLHGFACLYLADKRAWFIHPDTKPTAFLHLLPRLLDAVVRRGAFPAAQQGVSGLQFNAWEEFAS